MAHQYHADDGAAGKGGPGAPEHHVGMGVAALHRRLTPRELLAAQRPPRTLRQGRMWQPDSMKRLAVFFPSPQRPARSSRPRCTLGESSSARLACLPTWLAK